MHNEMMQPWQSEQRTSVAAAVLAPEGPKAVLRLAGLSPMSHSSQSLASKADVRTGFQNWTSMRGVSSSTSLFKWVSAQLAASAATVLCAKLKC